MRPNILIYFTDQQRADTCGCFGQPLDVTPNLDRLAAEGVAFDQAFTPQPVCGPVRAILQTGRYATDLGCFRNNVRLPENVKTVARYLAEAGYETGYVGKWHLASDGDENYRQRLDFFHSPVPPELRGGYAGFWRAADVLEFTSDGYGGYVFDECGNKIPFDGYRVDCLTDMALEFLDQRDALRPFFLTVSHLEPHHQNDARHYQGPPGSKERFRDFVPPPDLAALEGDWPQEYPDYLGACASLDENLGRIIAKLKEKGLDENTVILFLSDHGSHFRTRNKAAQRRGGDDYKRTCHDAALRVPLVISGGPFRGGRRVRSLVSTGSVPRTVLSLAGIDAGDAMIGEDLLDVVNGANPNRPERIFAQISESRVERCIRTPDWLYSVYAPGANGFTDPSAARYVDAFLYDLRADPCQLNNLAGDPAHRAERDALRAQLLDWIEEAEGYRPEIVERAQPAQKP